MVKLIVISTAVILVLVNCLAQPAPCLDVVDGEYVNGQLFFDPVYANGQSFGYYNRSVVDNDNQIQRISMDQPGFLWHWVSSYFTPYNRNSGSALLPVLKTEPDSPQTGAFDFFFAPSVNGEFFSNNYGKLTRTCGKDNMTLVDGPGPMIPQTKGNWILSNLVPYNLTFSQQLYVPSGSSSNWARLVHFITAESDVEINYWSDSVWAVQLFVHSQSVAERYHLYTDLDQGAFLRMPTTINFMGENGRTMVTAANNADCSSTSTSAQTFKLKAGQTAAFAHFVSQNFDVNQAVSTAQWIDTQPTEAFAKLTDDELSQIMNWDACAAVLGPQVTVKVDQSDKCSKTPTLTIALTTSLSYTSTHHVIRADGSVAQSVSDTSFTMSESGAFTLETWMNNCVVKRTPFDVVINDLAFSANTFSGSNKPFSFSFDSATKTLTATDTCGCKAEGVLSA